MIFHIKHATRYRYTRPVFCEPMTLRLRPREEAAQRLLRFNLWIDPQPAGTCEFADVDGHTAVQIWFERPLTSLSIVVSSIVETLRSNPFDFLLSPEGVQVPLRYASPMRDALTPYLPPRAIAPEVQAAADAVLSSTGGRMPHFLTELTRWMYEGFERVARPHGDAREPTETLARRQGCCRDLTVLFNEICRAVGLAARFVSGYHDREATDGRRYLHAWSEVYLPGAGWRGFDPTEGLAVADRHVSLAAGAVPLLAAPTIGTFRGNGAESTMETQLIIRTGERAENVESVLDAALAAR